MSWLASSYRRWQLLGLVAMGVVLSVTLDLRVRITKCKLQFNALKGFWWKYLFFLLFSGSVSEAPKVQTLLERGCQHGGINCIGGWRMHLHNSRSLGLTRVKSRHPETDSLKICASFSAALSTRLMWHYREWTQPAILWFTVSLALYVAVYSSPEGLEFD